MQAVAQQAGPKRHTFGVPSLRDSATPLRYRRVKRHRLMVTDDPCLHRPPLPICATAGVEKGGEARDAHVGGRRHNENTLDQERCREPVHKDNGQRQKM